jgi:nitroimidazol reductase NimA-like FMN-containing flavoprotein (pyridoxamine 5'-phosphate oxidase superfamily)
VTTGIAITLLAWRDGRQSKPNRVRVSRYTPASISFHLRRPGENGNHERFSTCNAYREVAGNSGHGMKLRGPWDAATIGQFLADAVIPARIAVLAGNGTPLVLSLWFLHRDGAIWCACNSKARVIELLRNNPRCGFEVAVEAPPYRGVRGQGRAQLDAPGGARVLADLLERYRIPSQSRLAKMLTREAANEVAIRIDPDWVTSWDFSARMSDV